MTDDDAFDETLRGAFAAAPGSTSPLAGVVARGVARRRRRLGLRVALLAIIFACTGAIVAVRADEGRDSGLIVSPTPPTTPVGPLLPDANNPTKPDTHWHAALGVYDCDHWMGDVPGSGIWQWPYKNAEDQPSRASDPNVYAGLHSHNDGVIHMEPAVVEETGNNATLGLYFEYGGWQVSETGFDFLGTAVKNGDACAGRPGSLQWAVARWNADMTGKRKQTYVVHTGNPADYKLLQGDIVVIAFLPEGKTIATIGDPPSVPDLAMSLGVEPVMPAVANGT